MLANAYWPGFFLAKGFASAFYVILPSLLLEALALRFTRRSLVFGPRLTFRQAIGMASLANLISAIFGLALLLVSPMLEGLGAGLVESPWLELAAHFAITSVIELIIYLSIFRRFVQTGRWAVVVAVLVGNLLSYALLFVALMSRLTLF